MKTRGRPLVAIVDYGMGNLFSVSQACAWAGLNGVITGSPDDVLAADAVILPGVGAFGRAMETLHRRGLVAALQRTAASSKPLVGICLGMQLLMTESAEFGRHEGLGVVPGTVDRLEGDQPGRRVTKVPHACWNRLHRHPSRDGAWAGTLLESLPDGVFMYFIHSYYVTPASPDLVIATTHYGSRDFCSAFSFGSIFACQCHPERSGPQGLRVYANLASRLGVVVESENTVYDRSRQ